MALEDFDIKKIKLEELELDLENSRLPGPFENEQECLEAIFFDEHNKLEKIAKDISENGIGLAPIVVELREGKKIVKDGNRRVATLKMLHNPKLCPDSKKITFFQKLNKSVGGGVKDAVFCYVTEDEEAIEEHIDRTHGGEMDGIGRVEWLPIMRARKAALKGKHDENEKAFAVLKWIGFEEDNYFAITNLQRLIAPKMLKLMGLKFNKKSPPSVSALEEYTKPLLKEICVRINDRKLKVSDIDNFRLAESYIKKIMDDLSISPKLLPSAKTTKNGDTFIGDWKDEAKPSWERDTWIPENPIKKNSFGNNKRAWNVYNELQDSKKLSWKKCPNAIAVMARVFLEFSIGNYIEKNEITRKGGKSISIEKDKIKECMKLAIRHMSEQEKITEEETERYKGFAGGGDALFSLSSMHSYLHSKDSHPDRQGFNIAWDNMESFIIKCWEG